MTSNKKRVRLSDIIGPAFYETHKLIDMGVIDEAVESGGRASLKSSYVGTEVVLQLVKHPDCHALVTRQVGDTMRDSVYAQILWAIDKLGLTTKFKCTQSPLQCTYLPTGQRILFRGLDDPQKIKSIKLPFGYIGILWFEEADQIKGGEDAVRNVQQSALRGGEFGLTFISFNPPAASRNWANRYAREERKGKRIHHSTYLQAPAAWLGPKFLAQAEYNSLQRRIGHLNCGHTANPIILGVNAPQYTEAQLQKFKDDNERGVVYNGYRYTLYEAGQEQSRIENGIRLIKRQILADEETESPDLQKHQIKLRVVQAEYARFCKAVGLPARSERLQVAGFGRSRSNRAVWAYKKAAPEQLRDVEIAGHKLYSVTDERIRAVPKPFFQGVSNKVNGLAQEYARGVLKKVQGLEVGTEAVVNFTKDGKCTGYYVGGQNSMKVKPPEMQVPYYSLHNHPSNGILSPEDIQQLIKRPQMQGIGAVGNAGALFTCEKVFGYSQKNAEGWFKTLKKKYPLYKGESGKIEDALAQRIAFAEELRRDGAKYGLVFSR